MIDFDILCKRILQERAFEKCNGTVEFSENNMFLTMTLPKESWCVKKLDGKFQTLKKALRTPKCSDAVVWMQTDSGQWNLHIFELKETVTKFGKSSGWDHIKCQFVRAYRLCKMIAAALDIEFEQVVFYTVFTNDDDISSVFATDVSETDDTEDPSILLPDRDMPDDMPSPRIEWASEKCRFDDNGWSDNYTTKEHPHKRILLTESINETYVATGSLVLTGK